MKLIFPHKLLSNNRQVSRIRKAFANGSSANIEFSKTRLSQMIQLRRYLLFLSLLIPAKAISKGINKVQDLANKVPDDKFIKIVNVLNVFRKNC